MDSTNITVTPEMKDLQLKLEAAIARAESAETRAHKRWQEERFATRRAEKSERSAQEMVSCIPFTRDILLQKLKFTC